MDIRDLAEKIAKDTTRYESKGKDLAEYLPSKMAEIAREALAEEK